LKENTCAAVDCDVTTSYLFCIPHYRLLSKEDRDALRESNYQGISCVKAIETIAERENKEITLAQYTELINHYENK
jgi:hypothetical protein